MYLQSGNSGHRSAPIQLNSAIKNLVLDGRVATARAPHSAVLARSCLASLNLIQFNRRRADFSAIRLSAPD